MVTLLHDNDVMVWCVYMVDLVVEWRVELLT